jgi:hypothetical protein
LYTLQSRGLLGKPLLGGVTNDLVGTNDLVPALPAVPAASTAPQKPNTEGNDQSNDKATAVKLSNAGMYNEKWIFYLYFITIYKQS